MVNPIRPVLAFWNPARAGLTSLLALSFGALGLLLTAGMAVLADRVASRYVQNTVEERVADTAEQMRHSLDRGMFERWRDIQIAASLDSMRDPNLDVNAKREILAKLQTTYPDYAIIALVDSDGDVIATSNRLAEGTNVSKREYFVRGKTAPFVGDVRDAIVLAKLLPQRDGETPRFLDVAAPIVDRNGSFAGIIVAHLYWEWANEVRRSVLNPLKEKTGAEVLIVARDGTVQLGPPSLQGQHLDLPSIRAAQNGESGSKRERWPDGQTYLTGFELSQGYRDYPGLGWTILVREHLDTALAPARDIRSSLVKASLFAALAVVLLSILIARRITKPLRTLTVAAENAQRVPGARFEITNGYAEVTSLSRSLVALLDDRRRREEDLRRAHDKAKRSEAEARVKEASFRLLFKANPVPMYVVSTETMQFLAVNEAALAFYGYTHDQFLSMTLLDIRPSEERHRVRQTVRTMGSAYEADRPWRHLLRDGSERQVLTSVRKLRYEGKNAALVAVIDITERLVAEAELRRTQQFLAVVVESMPAILVVKDAREQRFVLANKAAEHLLGISREELLGKTDYDFFPKEQADFFAARNRDVINSGEVQIIDEEPVQTQRNGERLLATKKLAIKDEAGKPQFLLIMSEDITERRRAEARVAHMAHHDGLTGLPNRALVHEHLAAAINRTRNKPSEEVALLCLDLDNFKHINDALGHGIGDKLLRALGQRLKDCAREGSLVARLGGDEFAIIETVSAADGTFKDAHSVALRVLAAVREPFEVDKQKIFTSASIGIVVAPHDGDLPEVLMRNADIAVHRAKQGGRDTHRFFEPGMDAAAQSRRSMEADLRDALTRNEFEVHYQPLVRISTGEINGVEALLRWRHPVRGMVSPAEFIPLAEETKLIVPLGEWVLHQACAEVASWPGRIRVAVNLSAVQFKNANVPELVAAVLSAAGLCPSRLEVEITETAILDEEETTRSALEQLRDMGVRISMDDFGTGYSSLSYLRKYPFHKIKIDQSFVRGLSYTAESQAIVQAVVGMAATLGMTSTAEGVETEEQLKLLQAAGCQEAQGYLFGRPSRSSEIRRLLEERKSFGGRISL